MGQYNENHKKKKIREELKKCIESEEYFRKNYIDILDSELYKKALPKIEGFEGKVIITSTPLGNNHFKELWEKSKKDPK
jgi:hypothetical protein